MPDKVTLILPDGAWDYPSSHGEIEYYPRRLYTDREYPALQNGGPWVIEVPFDVYPYFCRGAGFVVMEPDQPAIPPEAITMKRLRKVTGGDASCNWAGQHFESDADGIITVPHIAVGELVESHGYEELPEPLAQIDAGLEQVHEGVAAQGERVEQLREEALAQVPEEKAEEARAEIDARYDDTVVKPDADTSSTRRPPTRPATPSPGRR